MCAHLYRHLRKRISCVLCYVLQFLLKHGAKVLLLSRLDFCFYHKRMQNRSTQCCRFLQYLLAEPEKHLLHLWYRGTCAKKHLCTINRAVRQRQIAFYFEISNLVLVKNRLKNNNNETTNQNLWQHNSH